MKLGIGSFAFAWSIGVPGHRPAHPMDAFSLVKTAADLEVGLVQIADNLPLHELTHQKLQQLIDHCERLKVSVEVGTRGLYPERVKDYLDIASKFSSPFLRLVVDDRGFEPTQREIVQEIRKLLPLFKEKQIILAIENHDRFRAHQLAAIVQDTDPEWVGICLDTANSLGAGEGMGEVMDQLAPYSVNLHIKDVEIKRVPSNMGFAVSGCPAGQGVIDIPWLVNTLSKNRNFFSVTLELWPEFSGDLEQTIRTEHSWVRQSLTYLKGIMGTI